RGSPVVGVRPLPGRAHQGAHLMRMKIIGFVMAIGMAGSAGAYAAGPDATPSGSTGLMGGLTGDLTGATKGGAAGTASGSSVTSGALSLDQLCMHTRLSPADQADCKARANAATTDTQRLEVRRTFEAKAGLRAGPTGTSGAGATTGRPPN